MKLQAVIFDWAGTTVDHGSLAPLRVMQKLFAQHQVPISASEARTHMGLLKRDHIEKTLSLPRVQKAWTDQHGHAPTDDDVSELFAEFIPLQLDCLAEHSTVIHGVPEMAVRLRARGLKIGSSTGYTRPMLDLLLTRAADQGYVPDCAVSPDDVGGGRPHPWMIYQNAIQLKVHPLFTMVKVGDTESDVEEGRTAGMWTVGVVRTGNALGFSDHEWEALPESDQQWHLDRGRARMAATGAHYLVDTVAQIDGVLEQIDERLARGERP